MKENVLSRLKNVKSTGGGNYRACCPSHDSTGRTLSLLCLDDGRILIHCHASCATHEVLEAIGLSMSDLFPDGAIKHFMASANRKPKSNKAEIDHHKRLAAASLSNFEDQQRALKPGERFTEQTMRAGRELFLKVRGKA